MSMAKDSIMQQTVIKAAEHLNSTNTQLGTSKCLLQRCVIRMTHLLGI
jgi:hypothetical protein